MKIFQCTRCTRKNFKPDIHGTSRNCPVVSRWGFPLFLVLSPPLGVPPVPSPVSLVVISHHGEVPVTVLCFPCYLSSLAMSARLSHSAIGSPYDRTPAHCPNAANLRPSPWWSSSGVTATTCLHSNWLLTKSLRQNKHTHRGARIPSG